MSKLCDYTGNLKHRLMLVIKRKGKHKFGSSMFRWENTIKICFKKVNNILDIWA